MHMQHRRMQVPILIVFNNKAKNQLSVDISPMFLIGLEPTMF